MSLVVAKKTNKFFCIVGDSQLTLTNATHQNPLQGILKSVILSSNLCVSFAGNLHFAEEAIRTIPSIEKSTLQTVIDHFLRWHEKSTEAHASTTDFILAIGEPHFCLIAIKDARANNVETTWIGNQDAFSEFQEYMQTEKFPPLPHPPEGNLAASISAILCPEHPDADHSTYTRMNNAMDAVIYNQKHKDVGGFKIPIATHKNDFCYMPYMRVYPEPVVLPPVGAEKVIPFGTVEQGGYAISFMISDSAYPACAAIHILQAKIGVVFLPDTTNIPKSSYIFQNIDEIEFREMVDREYGIKGGGLDNYVARGVRLAKQGRFEEALEDLNKAIQLNPVDAEAYNNRGGVFCMLERFELAIADFSKAIELNPTYQKAYLNRAKTFERIGRTQEATNDMQTANTLRSVPR
ncbi:MAG: tetratricopeptide repeat protein [Candidatus Tectomicrobia bacterium]|uniref:Tetratricopeptide repeat protein n=1 Tax=Tectimicrobiota bacterium TaxID=2528274 RepID=A0A932I4P0_UNCTE|nr:tetratricopeptide repeat protein [Candidatus Tectomicrobia bacterium]